uniref:Uncharacterized protein n=1 Tax=Rhizophagus irregularis (strain DAOM 181602 / DAOM 197198 / MUCL 43194) TaxID=747089 RepID=U9UDA3_RHIID
MQNYRRIETFLVKEITGGSLFFKNESVALLCGSLLFKNESVALLCGSLLF